MRSFIDDSFVAFAFLVFTVPVLIIYGFAIIDLVRRGQLSVVRKLGWGIGLVLLPAIGMFLYFVMRPTAPPPGKIPDVEETGFAAAVEALRAKWEAGTLGDADFLAAKRQLLRV